MQAITTLTDKCRKCYSCVRSCPVKAIKVEGDFSEIIPERCIGCGNCLGSCPQHAKVVTDKARLTEQLLDSGVPVIAVLGCSFPAFFHNMSPGQLCAGLKQLGFAEVHEGAYGAELIASGYRDAIAAATTPLISSHCPAVVAMIERHYPELVSHLVPVVSPMVAMGRFLRSSHSHDIRVVYLSSCVAAKFDQFAGRSGTVIDIVLTYREVEEIFRARAITPTSLPEIPFDGVEPHLGRLFSIPGGVFKALSIPSDPLDTEVVTAEGEVNALGIIHDLAQGRISPRIADIRFCYDGCIGGPGRNNELTGYYKRNLIIRHFAASTPYTTALPYRSGCRPPSIDRDFTDRHAQLPVPRAHDVKKIMQATNKFTRKDELNCRACGYHTCREYAVAVYQGLANLDMCLQYNLQRLEEDRGRLIQNYELARRELEREYGDEFIVGNDSHTLEVLDLIRQVSPTLSTVLIRGESGTGKELTARSIHRHSLRNDKPLVTVNCTAITGPLLESELFGHRKGAFAGATNDKKGLFEAADGGTIFLDEIGDISLKVQAELLRVLDLGEVRPVGGTVSRKIDVRLIAASSKNLEKGIGEGWFRADLYYRINVVTVTLPPLRNRVGSIQILAHHFLEKARHKLNRNFLGIEERAIKAMMQYPWPGNVREMQNVIERAAVLAHDEVVKLGNLPLSFAENYAESAADVPDLRSFKHEREPHVLRVEKKLILRYLADADGNVSKAAQLANIPRRTFYRLLDRHGLKEQRVRNLQNVSRPTVE